VQRLRIGVWIVVAAATCAALGAWLGSHLDDGNTGMVALVGATAGVLGSFLPNSVLWVRARLRRTGGPSQGAA
jgi:hypothetical protein